MLAFTCARLAAQEVEPFTRHAVRNISESGAAVQVFPMAASQQGGRHPEAYHSHATRGLPYFDVVRLTPLRSETLRWSSAFVQANQRLNGTIPAERLRMVQGRGEGSKSRHSGRSSDAAGRAGSRCAREKVGGDNARNAQERRGSRTIETGLSGACVSVAANRGSADKASGVGQAAVAVSRNSSGGEKLVAYVVPDEDYLHSALLAEEDEHIEEWRTVFNFFQEDEGSQVRASTYGSGRAATRNDEFRPMRCGSGSTYGRGDIVAASCGDFGDRMRHRTAFVAHSADEQTLRRHGFFGLLAEIARKTNGGVGRKAECRDVVGTSSR